jgi:hypothetical protein
MIPKAKITDLIKTPAFFRALRYQYGSYPQAGKALGISGDDFREIAELSRQDANQYSKKISDVKLERIQRAISKMSRGNYIVAERFVKAEAQGLTPGQLAYAAEYTAGRKRAHNPGFTAAQRKRRAQRYFRKAVNDFYEGKTERVLMPAIGRGGKITNSPTVKKKTR